ncbi:glycosyltransferase involved in cell wall biosynthesis [Panacagrimonas perspica]|uniref:Glycosyltransferase involved in cell wall biosynthesis n=1 Tax=Panacagrimonas perspica TaxID=381431 RepID=A0A4S3KA71_9GAMM|nr:glycosyltransferase [Panacagrimonas perspica]TDU24342.1 glycosyltransferase involved in cell wall biosynthesis [Panacagrimonas perspica]THD04734.1 glycosyl transferase [Panacagrimonas perspica]
MKVLHVETGLHLYGGAQQVAFLLRGLADRGVQNLLVCPPGAAIGQHFAGSAVKVLEVPCSGDADLGFLFRLRRVLHEQRPDVVHLHSRRGADVLGALAARLAGLPVVLSRRVDNPESRAWVGLKYRLHDRVIAISQGIADVLAAEGVPAMKLRVVRSSLDPKPWQQPEPRAVFLAEFGLPTDVVTIGVVAQLIERKGHRILFDALRALPDRAGLRVICFGQGPLAETLRREATDLGDIVRFAGFRKDLARWVGALDLLVHPALMEGLGISLLQASAAGVPIIACRAGGMPEAVADGVSGLLVEPGDVAGLASALRALIGDPALRTRLGTQGRARIEREFSVENMVDGNLAVYRELVPSP